MGTDNIIFLENLEWFDETGKELVQCADISSLFSGSVVNAGKI